MSAFAKRVLANVREEIRAEVAYALELAGEPELLEALKALAEFADKMTGRAEPAYAPIAHAFDVIAKAEAAQ